MSICKDGGAQNKGPDGRPVQGPRAGEHVADFTAAGGSPGRAAAGPGRGGMGPEWVAQASQPKVRGSGWREGRPRTHAKWGPSLQMEEGEQVRCARDGHPVPGSCTAGPAPDPQPCSQ